MSAALQPEDPAQALRSAPAGKPHFLGVIRLTPLYRYGHGRETRPSAGAAAEPDGRCSPEDYVDEGRRIATEYTARLGLSAAP